jgi:dTDP-4-amino-4,6-dideoxygalactose transaminase
VISLVDLHARHLGSADAVEAAVLQVLRSGQWIGGTVVADLEREMAQLMGWSHSIGVANGTDALEICMRALGIGPGDEVIIPAVSFFATAGAVCRAGARPVIVDTLPDRPLLDWTQVENARSESTRAVIPVHLFGLNAGCSNTDLEIIDDLAQTVGATPPPGGGRMGALSFYPTKMLSCAGDGGLVLCREPELAERVHLLGNHGNQSGLHHQVQGSVGGNSRLDAIHAAALLAQLPGLASRTTRRREIYQHYRSSLGEQVIEHEPGSSVSILCLRHPERDALRKHLERSGVATGCYYPMPLTRQPALEHARVIGPMTHAESFCREALALPCHAALSDSDIDRVIAAVKAWS